MRGGVCSTNPLGSAASGSLSSMRSTSAPPCWLPWIDWIAGCAQAGNAPAAAGTVVPLPVGAAAPATGASPSFANALTQERDVDEPDLLKTDGVHLFSLDRCQHAPEQRDGLQVPALPARVGPQRHQRMDVTQMPVHQRLKRPHLPTLHRQHEGRVVEK